MMSLKPKKNDLIAMAVIVAAVAAPYLWFWMRGLSLGAVEFEGASQWNPFWTFARRELARGHFALWTPHTLGGWPLAGFPHAALFYPLSIFFYLIPYERATLFNTAFHLIVSSLLMYRFMRRLGRSEFSSALAAMAWTSGGFYFVFSTFVPLLWTITWAPLFFDSAVGWLKSGKRNELLLFIAASALGFLGGSVESLFYEFMTLAVAIVFMFFKPSIMAIQPKRAAALALSILPIVLLAAVQFAPAAELSSLSVRSVGLSYEYFASRGVPIISWLFTLFPPVNPAALLKPGPVDFLTMLRFAPFLGFTTVIFMAYSFFWGGKPTRAAQAWALGLCVFLAVFMARQYTIIGRIEYLLPVVNMLREPGYGMFIPQLILIALAASGMDAFLRVGGSERTSRGKIAAVVALFAVGNITVAWKLPPANPLGFLDLDKRYVDFFKNRPSYERHQVWDGFGIRTGDLPPAAGMIIDTQTLDGWEGSPLLRYALFLDLIDNGAVEFDDKGRLKEVGHHRVFRTGDYLKPNRFGAAMPFLSFAGIKYFVKRNFPLDPRVEALFEEMYESGADKKDFAVLADNGAFPRAFVKNCDDEWGDFGNAVASPRVDLSITDYTADRVALKPGAAANGCAILTDNYCPGWEATVDGKPERILPVYVAFRGVPINSTGWRSVEFTYRPRAFRVGLWATMASLLALAAVFLAKKNIAD